MQIEDYAVETSFCINEDVNGGLSRLSLVLVSSLKKQPKNTLLRYPKFELLPEVSQRFDEFAGSSIERDFCSILRLQCAVAEFDMPDMFIFNMESPKNDSLCTGLVLSFEAAVRVFLGLNPFNQSSLKSVLEGLPNRYSLYRISVKKISALQNYEEVEFYRNKHRDEIEKRDNEIIAERRVKQKIRENNSKGLGTVDLDFDKIPKDALHGKNWASLRKLYPTGNDIQ